MAKGFARLEQPEWILDFSDEVGGLRSRLQK
jgi:hypothetical protein